MANFHQLKTIELETTKDPYKNLWRNVLIVGIEDLFRKKEVQYRLKRKKYCVEEMWLYHEDFDLICEFAQLNPKLVRVKVINAIKIMERKYVNQKNNLPSLPRKWFYKTNEVNRRADGSYTPMSAV